MTIYETPQMHVLHVYGDVDIRGAVLCFRHYEALVETLLGKALGRTLTHGDHAVVSFAGSSYEVFYAQTDRVEAYTVREKSSLARPLGLTQEGPRVTQLHFYRPHGKAWQQLGADLHAEVESREPALV